MTFMRKKRRKRFKKKKKYSKKLWMMDNENFRYTFYNKVSLNSVEDKKTLEMLLEEKSLDRKKLEKFCLGYCVPHIHRNFVWKLLLGVIPRYMDSQNFIMNQRKQQCQDLLKTLKVIDSIDESTPMHLVLLGMWSIETRNFCFNINLIQEKCPEAKSFVAIVKFLLYCFDDDTDVYWIARNFTKYLQTIQNDFPKLFNFTYTLIEKEDPELYLYLKDNGILNNLPLNQWFKCCFAGILNENCIAKIWDKICAGSYKILAFLVTSLLTNLKHRITRCRDANTIINIIQNISQENADIIINEAIDMWQNYGSPLTLCDKSKSIHNI